MTENEDIETVDVDAEEAEEVNEEVDVEGVAEPESSDDSRLAALEERIDKLTEALEAATKPQPAKKTRGSKPPSLNTSAELPTIEDDASLSQWQREELFLKKRRSWINRQASKTRGGS